MDTMYQDMLADLAEEQKNTSNPINEYMSEPNTEKAMAQEKPHKILPHLGGRRVYSEIEAENAPISKTDEKPKANLIEKAEEIARAPEEKKAPSGGINLDNVPRPILQREENTVKGIVYTYETDPAIANFIPTFLTRHTSIDKGNSIPRFFRMTTSSILCDSKKILNTNVLPFGGIIQPFAELGEFEDPVPVSPNGGEQIMRCDRCGAYVNPGFAFFEAETKYKCNLCEKISKLDFATGPTSMDRAELKKGTYEFIAPPILSGKKAKGHNILFLIECTANALNHGLTQQVIASIKATLDYFPDPENTNLGFATYSNVVQFFSLSSATSEIQIVNMSDALNPFAPLPAGAVLINLAQHKSEIELVLERILSLNYKPEKTHYTSSVSCGGAAVKAAVNTMAQYFGKVLWFLMDIPSVGFGTLKSRNQSSLYNLESERSLYNPDTKNPSYLKLAEYCLEHKVAVDIFACTQTDIDLASLLPMSSYIGGEINFYSPFKGIYFFN